MILQNLSFIESMNKRPLFGIDEIVARALEDKVPVVSYEIGRLLALTVKMRRPRKILEVGSGYGVSTLFMASGDPSAKIQTIDGNATRASFVKEQVMQNGLQDRIAVRYITASDFFKECTEEFDMIFLDCAKKDYIEIYEQCLGLLAPKGLLMADNILFKGVLASGDEPGPRHKAVAESMRQFIETVGSDARVDAHFLEIGDGALLAFKNPL